MHLSKFGFFKKKRASENMAPKKCQHRQLPGMTVQAVTPDPNVQLNLMLANLKNYNLRQIFLVYLRQELRCKKKIASSTKRMLMKLKNVRKKNQAKRRLLLKKKLLMDPKVTIRRINHSNNKIKLSPRV